MFHSSLGFFYIYWLSLGHGDLKSSPCWILLSWWKRLHCITNLNFNLSAPHTWTQEMKFILWLHLTLLSIAIWETKEPLMKTNKHNVLKSINRNQSIIWKCIEIWLSRTIINCLGSSVKLILNVGAGNIRLLNVSDKI